MNRVGIEMTYRVYVRWPGQKVSDKTVTESRAVADLAYQELITRTDWPGGTRPLGVAYTQDGKQVAYLNFEEAPNGSRD
jgi:hypothetical protein